MRDSYGRTIDYLRVSITDRCNLRCRYCMPAQEISYLPQSETLTVEEILLVVKIMANQGLRHVKITGGEPLVRRDCGKLIASIKEISGIETVTLTTNGILLSQMADELARTGVDGVNISLDTLNPKKFFDITRGGDISAVLDGLASILRYESITTKINCVLAGEDWKADAIALAGLAKHKNVSVRFIERMPIGLDADSELKRQELVQMVLEERYGSALSCEKPFGFGPSTYLTFEDFVGKIGFISAISHKFCSNCNRVRLTADGKFRLCLQSESSKDLKVLIRGKHPEKLEKYIEQAIKEKPKQHQFQEKQIETLSMSQIGG